MSYAFKISSSPNAAVALDSKLYYNCGSGIWWRTCPRRLHIFEYSTSGRRGRLVNTIKAIFNIVSNFFLLFFFPTEASKHRDLPKYSNAPMIKFAFKESNAQFVTEVYWFIFLIRQYASMTQTIDNIFAWM